MTYDEIITKVARETGLEERFVDRTYRSYWRVVREHIKSLPLKEDLSDEEFLELQPNVNIPSIGKLYVTPKRYRQMKNRHEVIQEHIKNKQKLESNVEN